MAHKTGSSADLSVSIHEPRRLDTFSGTGAMSVDVPSLEFGIALELLQDSYFEIPHITN